MAKPRNVNIAIRTWMMRPPRSRNHGGNRVGGNWSIAGGVQFRFGRYLPRRSSVAGFLVVVVVVDDGVVDSADDDLVSSTSDEMVALDFVDRIALIASSADDVSDSTLSKSFTFVSGSNGDSLIDAEYTFITLYMMNIKPNDIMRPRRILRLMVSLQNIINELNLFTLWTNANSEFCNRKSSARKICSMCRNNY